MLTWRCPIEKGGGAERSAPIEIDSIHSADDTHGRFVETARRRSYLGRRPAVNEGIGAARTGLVAVGDAVERPRQLRGTCSPDECFG